MSALEGRQRHGRSARMPWYRGPALMEYLETVAIEDDLDDEAFPHARAMGHRAQSRFPRICGLIASGVVRPGDRVRVLPSGRESRIARIVTHDGDLAEGRRGPVRDAHARGRNRCQPRRRHRGRRCRTGGRRPIRGDRHLDERGADAARPALSLEGGDQDGDGERGAAETQGQRQHARASGGQEARAQRDRRVQSEPRRAHRLRSLHGQSRHGRLHSHRSPHQRHGGRGPPPFRAPPRRQHPLAGARRRARMRARA